MFIKDNGMPKLIYVGDSTSHGGIVKTGTSRISLNGRSAARKNDKVTCPLCGDNEIAEGDERIMDGEFPLAFHGHRTRCGAMLISSSEVTGIH